MHVQDHEVKEYNQNKPYKGLTIITLEWEKCGLEYKTMPEEIFLCYIVKISIINIQTKFLWEFK